MKVRVPAESIVSLQEAMATADKEELLTGLRARVFAVTQGLTCR